MIYISGMDVEYYKFVSPAAQPPASLRKLTINEAITRPGVTHTEAEVRRYFTQNINETLR